MRNILITGANRGIGVELARLFATRRETNVYAGCRNPIAAVELKRLVDDEDSNLEIVGLDVVDQDSIAWCVKQISRQTDSLYALINNAGIYGGTVSAPKASTSHFGSLEMDDMLEIFRVNSVAPLLVAQAFTNLLERSGKARIINVSSDAGSITLRESGGGYSYGASKAALNMISRTLAAELRDRGIIVVSVHPGFIKTDMGGPSAPMSPSETIPHLAALIEGVSLSNSGTFLNWDGREILW